MGQESLEHPGEALFTALLTSETSCYVLIESWGIVSIWFFLMDVLWWPQRWHLTELCPGTELWQPSCSPWHQKSLVSDYCGYGLVLISFLHQTLEEEGFNHSLLSTSLTQTTSLFRERSIHEWAFPCEKCKLPSLVKDLWNHLENPLWGGKACRQPTSNTLCDLAFTC